MLKDRKMPLLPFVVVVIVISGMLISFAPEPYSHDVSFDRDGDVLHYKYHSVIGSTTNTVAFSATGDFFIERVVMYLDDSYASITSKFMQEEMVEDLSKQLKMRGIDSICCDAKEVLEVIRTHDPGRTALLFASGAFPHILYDGTDDCPIIDWLDRGGILINESGCLGRYVSYGPNYSDIELTTGYGLLFAGVNDVAFNDLQKRAYATEGCDETLRDALQFYMNEVTFGIDISGIADAKNLGYVSDDGFSSAAIFKSRGGMVINFGVSLVNHSHFDHLVTQIIASGMDYSSEVFYSHAGDTRWDDGGDIELSDRPCVVYGYIGSPRAIYGERIFILS